MTTLRAQFDGKVLIPIDPVDLPRDQVLEIDVREAPRRGSPEALLQAIKSMRKVPVEDVDEMERLIEEGMQPTRYEGIFDDLDCGGDEKETTT